MFNRTIVIALSTLVIAALACSAPFIDNGRAASLSELRNSVQSKGDANAQFKSASEGDKIISNGGVKTGTDSRVRISVTDGTIIRLGDNTEFVLKELSAASSDPITNITLVSGKMWVAVTSALGNGKFDVNTPVGVASVRGSFMSVEIFQATGQMIVTCLEGLCRLASLASGRFVDLKTAEQSEIPGTGQDPTPPKKIDLKQVNDWRTIFPEAAQHVVAVGTPGALPTATRVGAGGAISGTAVGGTPAASGVGLTACDHPYFPIRNGASWNYTTSEGNMTWNANGVSGDKNNATGNIGITVTGGQFNRPLQCNAANGITADLFNNAVFGRTGGATIQMTTSNVSGVFLPAADKLKPGYSWNNSYDSQMQISGITINGKVNQQFSVTGVGKATVGGKSYDSIDVRNVVNIVSVPATTTITVTNLMTFAKGVGMVKVSAQGEGINSTMNLTTFTLP